MVEKDYIVVYIVVVLWKVYDRGQKLQVDCLEYYIIRYVMYHQPANIAWSIICDTQGVL